MIYNFMITEHLRKSVRVEADSREEAEQKIESLLNAEEIVLTADDFADRDVQTTGEFADSQGYRGEDSTNSPAFDVDMDFARGGLDG